MISLKPLYFFIARDFYLIVHHEFKLAGISNLLKNLVDYTYFMNFGVLQDICIEEGQARIPREQGTQRCR